MRDAPNTKTEAEKQLAKLVSMPTISDDIAANDTALDYIEDYLNQRGMYCTRDRFNSHGTLVASTRSDNAKTPTVLLAGHVDVMHASDKMYRLREEGDKLIGRGVYDMKFSIAGYMQWVDDHQDNLADYDVAIMITTDEEYGGRDDISGTHRLIEQGYHPKVCILPDSTAPGWDIETLAKGSWRFDLIAKGRTAHGSRPWEGDSASFKLLPALHELKEHFKGHGPMTDTLNIAVIEGGTTYNQVPEQMTARVEVRLMSKDSYAEKLSFMKNLCVRHNLEYQQRALNAPVKANLADPFIAAYLESVEAVAGRPPEGLISFAGTDAPYFDAVGVPCIISCPDGGLHHSEQEWISRKSFLQFVPILNDYLDKIAKQAIVQVDTKAALV